MSTPAHPIVVDIVDSQPLVRVGLAVALSHAPMFEPGEVRAHPGELPASDRPVVVGLRQGDASEVAAVRSLAGRSRTVLVLLPDHGWNARATLRQDVAGGLSRLAPVSQVMTALWAVVNGQSSWWLEPAGTHGEEVPTLVGMLSERERELLGLLAVGYSDREIADELVISVRTVWSHLERIRAKTGVRGRVELAMLAWHVSARPLPERRSHVSPGTRPPDTSPTGRVPVARGALDQGTARVPFGSEASGAGRGSAA